MKFGITKFYDPAPTDTGATKDVILKELGNIKSALEKKLSEDKANTEKNLDEKLAEVNTAIETLKATKPEVTADELKAIKDDLDITIKAFDKLQTRLKSQQMQNAGGHTEDNTWTGQIKKGLLENKEAITSGSIVGKKGKESIQMKAVQDMTVIGNVSTGVVPNTYRSGIIPQPYENVHLRDIVNVTPSDTDSYHFIRHAKTGEGSITWQGNENGTKSKFDEDFVEVAVTLDYLAGFLKISRKMLRNFSSLQATLTRWLPEKYYQAEDTKGYQAIIAQATGVANTDTGGGMIRQIIRTIGLQRKAKYSVNGIVVDGAVWANILTYTTTQGEFTQPIGVVTISPNGTLMICGIPVYVTSWVGGDEAIIGDWRFFEIIQSEGLQLGFFEQDENNVQKNMITVRIEASIGFAMLDPAAFAVASLETVS